MSTRWRWALGFALLPLIIGGVIWFVYFPLDWLPDYIVYSRISLGILAYLIGGLLTILCVLLIALTRFLFIRAEKKLTAERIEASTAHQQFLLRLDHELKNPITTLQVELANLDLADFSSKEILEEHTQTIQRLKEQTSRLSDLVFHLRKLAEFNTYTIEPEAVNLDQLLTELVDEYQNLPEYNEPIITLNLPQVPWPLPEIQGDPDLLYLALHNLLENAIKFTRPGDTIQIRAYEVSSYVIVEIGDTGPGIPEEELPHVWDELFRGKMARGTPGSGLGLALVKAIIELHAGEVVLKSRLSQGTIVTVQIPTKL